MAAADPDKHRRQLAFERETEMLLGEVLGLSDLRKKVHIISMISYLTYVI